MSSRQLTTISFDLDNALYDNLPVMLNAEADFHAYLKQQFDIQAKEYHQEKYLTLREKLITSDDTQLENVSHLRQTILKIVCQDLAGADEIANQAFNLFMAARSRVLIAQPIEAMLAALSDKFRLVSVSNGNCNLSQLSIGQFFQRNYSVTENYRAKPHPQMLNQVMLDFQLHPEQLIHVGDSLEDDGGAARNAGVNFYHFAPFTQEAKLAKSCQTLRDYFLN